MRDNKYIQRSYPENKSMNQIIFSYQYDERKNEGTHFVMWSGGTDSTLLLYELLEAYGADHVCAVSYKYPWLDQTKWENEKRHREAFKAKMKLRGERFSNFKHTEIKIDHTTISGGHMLLHNGGLPQAISWLLSIPIYCDNDSYVYEGGIRNDDLTLVLEGYHNMFEGICQTIDKKIVLREPYLYFSKAQVLERIFKYDLYEDTWYCEIPPNIGEKCYECQPCKTHLSALIEVASESNDELVRLKAQQAIDNIAQAKKSKSHAGGPDMKAEDNVITSE